MVGPGGAADYETGQGTDGSEAIFDPTHGAPEQFERKSRSGGIAGMFAGFGVNPDPSGGGDLEATGAAPTAAFDAFGGFDAAEAGDAAASRGSTKLGQERRWTKRRIGQSRGEKRRGQRAGRVGERTRERIVRLSLLDKLGARSLLEGPT